MEFETLQLSRNGDGTALVEIARPEKLNAMSRAFFAELPALLGELDEDGETVACVLTGAGRAFSAGGDFEDFEALGDLEDRRRQVRTALGAFHAVETAQTVVVAAVNGIALAGGTELTLACDVALASERARFGFREVTVGLMPAFGVVRGPELLGRSRTAWLALSGRDVSAAEAERLGIVHEVTPHGELLERAFGFAREVASRPRPAVRAAKQLINRRSAAGLTGAIEATAMLHGGEEHRRLIAEFLSSRREGA